MTVLEKEVKVPSVTPEEYEKEFNDMELTDSQIQMMFLASIPKEACYQA